MLLSFRRQTIVHLIPKARLLEVSMLPSANQFRCYSQEPKRLRESLNDLVHGRDDHIDERKISRANIAKRKEKARNAQTMTDYRHVLNPYMSEYFSSISNLLNSSPKFLDEKAIVASFVGFKSLGKVSDKYFVSKVVRENLKLNQPGYAMQACRMAKEHGTIGMNELLSHLIKTETFVTVFKVYNNLRKWGVPHNNLTFTILSSVGVSRNSKLHGSEIKSLMKVYDEAVKSSGYHKSKIIYTNATLASLSRLNSPQDALDFYEDIPTKGAFSRDNVTYTTILNMISRISNPEDLSKRNSLSEKIWKEYLDRVNKEDLRMSTKVLDAYCSSLSISENPESYRRSLEFYQKYFAIDPKSDSDFTKFPFTRVQLDILLKAALRTKNYSESLALYENLDKFRDVELDNSTVHNFLRNFAFVDGFDPSISRKLLDRAIVVQSKNSDGNNPIINSLTFHLICRTYKHSSCIDLKSIDDMILRVVPELGIPIDDYILSGYIACYHQATSRGIQVESRQLLNAVQFISKHLMCISDVSVTQRNPTRINKALFGAIQLSEYMLKNFHEYGSLSQLHRSVEKCKLLQQQLLENFEGNGLLKVHQKKSSPLNSYQKSRKPKNQRS